MGEKRVVGVSQELKIKVTGHFLTLRD